MSEDRAHDRQLVEQLRRTLGTDSQVDMSSEAVTAPATGSPRIEEESIPPDRAISSAAMAIADQIIGLEAADHTMGTAPALRLADGTVAAIDGERVIGRQPGADGLVVADGTVSRTHARVRGTGGRLEVEDLGSSNGTVVRRGDRSLVVGAEPVGLELGDVLLTSRGVMLATVVEQEPTS